MVSKAELAVSSFDHNELKDSLIQYLQTKPGFEDINYSGSAISTIIDLLVRNSLYTSFQANMLANESFLQSAQLRGNVSSHAQKLSYLPNSRTASRAIVDIEVTPSQTPTEQTIKSESGLIFISNIGGEVFTFVTRDPYTFSYSSTSNRYKAFDVELYQGQYLLINTTYQGNPVSVRNRNIDISTLRVYVNESGRQYQYVRAETLNQLDSGEFVYFLRENTQGLYEIEFGKNLIGREPLIGSIVTIDYINTQETIGNNVSTFIASGSIEGYSNINVITKESSFGGFDRDTIEDIRFIAPKAYQAQNRAVGAKDYEVLIKSNFPFIKSVRAWGGELSDPPQYGTVIISVIPEDGIRVTKSLLDRIKQTISPKSVGSVSIDLKEAEFFNLSLNITYKINNTVEGFVSNSDVDTFIKNTINTYSENSLRQFGMYYNQSEIIDLIKNRRDIEYISIRKNASKTLQIFPSQEFLYKVNFSNPIREGSFTTTQFTTTPASSIERMFDLDGKIFLSITVSGSTTTREIGTINYTTGDISLVCQFINITSLTMSVEPDDDNFNVSRNNYVEINNITTHRVLT